MANHTFTADPGSLEIVSTYTFDGPRQRVFEAYTDPELIPNWWAEGDLKVEKMEVKPGGSWRFVMGEGGNEFPFRGVYHDVIAPEKLVATWQFEGAPAVILQTVTFEEADGKTEVTTQMVFQSVEARDAMMQSGMDESSTTSMMERLAKLL